VVLTGAAPRPIGPYSQAVRFGNLLFVSGQVALDPATGRLVEGGIREQAERVLENIRAILEAAGFSLGDVVWVLVLLKDLSMYREFNEVYSRYFGEEPPARAAVGVSDLPAGALVEVTLVAARDDGG